MEHIALMERCIGPFPFSLIDRSKRGKEYFQRYRTPPLLSFSHSPSTITLLPSLLFAPSSSCPLCSPVATSIVSFLQSLSSSSSNTPSLPLRTIIGLSHCHYSLLSDLSKHSLYYNLTAIIQTFCRNGFARLESLSSASREYVASALTVRVSAIALVSSILFNNISSLSSNPPLLCFSLTISYSYLDTFLFNPLALLLPLWAGVLLLESRRRLLRHGGVHERSAGARAHEEASRESVTCLTMQCCVLFNSCVVGIH